MCHSPSFENKEIATKYAKYTNFEITIRVVRVFRGCFNSRNSPEPQKDGCANLINSNLIG
jgi:hypothetical protein